MEPDEYCEKCGHNLTECESRSDFMRNKFAAAALSALTLDSGWAPDDAAATAFSFADAMMVQQVKRVSGR